MNVKELTSCVEVLGQVAVNFADMPTEREESIRAGVACVLAQSIILKLATFIAAGLDPYEAMEATAKAALGPKESCAQLVGLLAEKQKA